MGRPTMGAAGRLPFDVWVAPQGPGSRPASARQAAGPWKKFNYELFKIL